MTGYRKPVGGYGHYGNYIWKTRDSTRYTYSYKNGYGDLLDQGLKMVLLHSPQHNTLQILKLFSPRPHPPPSSEWEMLPLDRERDVA